MSEIGHTARDRALQIRVLRSYPEVAVLAAAAAIRGDPIDRTIKKDFSRGEP